MLERKYLTREEILNTIDQAVGQNENRSDQRAFLFFCSILYWRYNIQSKEVEFLTLTYQENGDKEEDIQLKFPGGTSLFGENVYETAIRESVQEVGHRPSREKLNFFFNRHCFHRETGELTHIKCFFLSNTIGAAIKTKTGADKGETSPVFWTAASKLVLPEEYDGLFWGHREPFKQACEIIALKGPVYAHALASVLDSLDHEDKEELA